MGDRCSSTSNATTSQQDTSSNGTTVAVKSSAENDEDANVAIIALGLALNEDGSCCPELISRVRTACDCWIRHKGSVLLCTGGDTARTGIPEADVMSRLVRSHVGEERFESMRHRVLLERESFNTVENAIFCASILKKHKRTRVLLVTSDYHVPRASRIFEQVFRVFPAETKGLDGVSIKSVSAPTKNRTDFLRRIGSEKRMVAHRLNYMLDKFNPYGDTVAVPLLSKEEISTSLRALEALEKRFTGEREAS